jgi:hypothetical protein
VSNSSTLAVLWMDECTQTDDKAQWKPWGDANDGLLSSVFCATYAQDIMTIVKDLTKKLDNAMRIFQSKRKLGMQL